MLKWPALCILSAALFFDLNRVYPEDTNMLYTVDMTVGSVEVSHDGGAHWARAELDLVLKEQDVIRTGPSSSCEIGMPDDRGTFRLEEKTELGMDKLGKEIKLKVKTGSSFFDIFKNLLKDETLEVENETAVVSVRGTQFFVDNGTDEGSISVAEGSVLVKRNIRFDIDRELAGDFRDAVETRAGAGQEIRYSRRDNSEFIAKLNAFKGNREGIRKFLRAQRLENAKRLRPFRDRQRMAAIIKNHQAALEKIKERRKNMIKNKTGNIKKKVNLRKLKKKLN